MLLMSSSSGVFFHSPMSRGRRTAWLSALATDPLRPSSTGRMLSSSVTAPSPLYSMVGAQRGADLSPRTWEPDLNTIPARMTLPSCVTCWSVLGGSGTDELGRGSTDGRLGPAVPSVRPLFLEAGREEDGAPTDVPSSRRVGSRFLRFIPAISGAVPSITSLMSTAGKASFSGLAFVASRSGTNRQSR
jgi:hypothetical protein